MANRIDTDLNRFKDIVKGKVKNDMKKFMSSEHMIGREGNKTIKIPLNSINIPRFTFGSNQTGGSGMGDGDEGDPMPGQGQKGKGKGNKAGDGDGEENDFSVEFTPDELAELITQELNLPELENKGKGKISKEKSKYNKVGDRGVIKNFRRTFQNSLRRQMSSGTYDPKNPIIIPRREDQRYKTSSEIEIPEINAVCIYLLDISGSMGEKEKELAKNISFWIDTLLTHNYKTIENIFLIHDTQCKEVDNLQFYKASSGGGTKVSSGLVKIAELIETEYPFCDNNIYIYQFSDGDNLSNEDNNLCAQILKEKILPNCNAYNLCETKNNMGSGDFHRFIETTFFNEEKITVCSAESKDDTLKCIKAFFEKGK